MEEKFSNSDIEYITNRGNDLEIVQQQLDYFKNGIPKINLVKSATIGDGIFYLTDAKIQEYVAYFEKHKQKYSIQKFVPASGAASRMFQFLIEFLNEFDVYKDTINSYINKNNKQELAIFLFGLKNFPFYKILKEQTIALYSNYYDVSIDVRHYFLIKTLVSEEGLDYASKPKGILPFHTKENKIITAFGENILESDFIANGISKTKIHLTINEEFRDIFEQLAQKYPNSEITFSYQNISTDTISVSKNNKPFRLENKELFFRPGGHGALIHNLNNLDAQVIFMKNIDNVAQNNSKTISTYKKVLGGVLLKTQHLIFKYLEQLSEEVCSEEHIRIIKNFVEQKISCPLPEEFDFFQTDYKKDYLIKVLNRPIRVCGMVKNEGEPGGGPFWVTDGKGRYSLQIVESAQIDFNNIAQKEIALQATHFNPVDIVCGVYNYKGEKFNLLDFVDNKAAFITEKTKNGKVIKALELPGLWNGAMSKWTTIFIEVPLETFNPVKTVNDLLKPAHQSSNE